MSAVERLVAERDGLTSAIIEQVVAQTAGAAFDDPFVRSLLAIRVRAMTDEVLAALAGARFDPVTARAIGLANAQGLTSMTHADIERIVAIAGSVVESRLRSLAEPGEDLTAPLARLEASHARMLTEIAAARQAAQG